MTVKERISKLESLLSRVTTRAGAPRTAAPKAETHEAAPIAAAPHVAAAPVAVPTRAAEPAPARPPMTDPPPTRKPGAEIELDEDLLVAASAAPPPVEALGSRQRLVAAPAVDAAELPAEDKTDAQRLPPVSASPPSLDTRTEAPELEIGTAEDDADLGDDEGPEQARDEEEEEEPPSSSRRPIAAEPPLAELTFGDAPPLPAMHTPPPESGRQVAGPAVDLDFDGDSTGVRERPEEAQTAKPPSVAQKAATAPPPRELVPEITKATVPHGDVASFQGAPREFAPSTFGELLDATLGL